MQQLVGAFCVRFQVSTKNCSRHKTDALFEKPEASYYMSIALWLKPDRALQVVPAITAQRTRAPAHSLILTFIGARTLAQLFALSFSCSYSSCFLACFIFLISSVYIHTYIV